MRLFGIHYRRALRGGQPDVLQRLLEHVGRTLEPVYGFRSLLAFEAKFPRQDRGKIPITWARRGSPAFGQHAGLRLTLVGVVVSLVQIGRVADAGCGSVDSYGRV